MIHNGQLESSQVYDFPGFNSGDWVEAEDVSPYPCITCQGLKCEEPESWCQECFRDVKESAVFKKLF